MILGVAVTLFLAVLLLVAVVVDGSARAHHPGAGRAAGAPQTRDATVPAALHTLAGSIGWTRISIRDLGAGRFGAAQQSMSEAVSDGAVAAVALDSASDDSAHLRTGVAEYLRAARQTRNALARHDRGAALRAAARVEDAESVLLMALSERG
jgi:hypothetical protein